ncbi:MAG: hypothetical protein AAGF47_11490, partial [Planctomycetota bacterium]
MIVPRLLFVMLLALVCAGCATDAERAPRIDPDGAGVGIEDPRFGVFVRRRVDAVLGETLFVPIEFAGGFLPEDLGEVMLDDGRRLRADLYRIERIRAEPPPGQWLPGSVRWRAVRFGGPVPDDLRRSGFWAIVGDPPIDAVGQGIWIAGRRVQINWLPDPTEVARRVDAAAWSSPYPASIAADPARLAAITPELDTPDRRWRARLFATGLLLDRAPRRVSQDGRIDRVDQGPRPRPAAGPRFDDPVIERVASLIEAKWLIGLARLYDDDPELNRSVRRLLTTHVDFGNGALMPMWPTEAAPEAALLSDLLDQTLPGRERSRRVRLWVDRQPEGVAWVQSDAGGATGTRVPIATIGFANLGWQPVIASVASSAQRSAPTLETLPPLEARSLAAPVPAMSSGQRRVMATIGGRDLPVAIESAALPARPPAFRIDRFHADWTMTALRKGSPSGSPPSLSSGVAVQLYKDHLGRWVLYAVLDESPAAAGSADTLRLALGLAGSSRDLTIEFTPSGPVNTDELTRGRPWLT